MKTSSILDYLYTHMSPTILHGSLENMKQKSYVGENNFKEQPFSHLIGIVVDILKEKHCFKIRYI